MQYTKATEVSNAFDPEGTPMIALGFMSGKVERVEIRISKSPNLHCESTGT